MLRIFVELHVQDVRARVVATKDTTLSPQQLWRIELAGLLVLLASKLQQSGADFVAAVTGMQMERKILELLRRSPRPACEHFEQLTNLVA